jgi:hypothetical protein
VALGPDVNPATIDPDQTDLCVPAPQVSEEILWLVVPEESVKMMPTVPPHRHASTSNAKIHAKTLAELKPSANQSTMVLSARVLMDTSVIR